MKKAFGVMLLAILLLTLLPACSWFKKEEEKAIKEEVLKEETVEDKDMEKEDAVIDKDIEDEDFDEVDLFTDEEYGFKFVTSKACAKYFEFKKTDINNPDMTTDDNAEQIYELYTPLAENWNQDPWMYFTIYSQEELDKFDPDVLPGLPDAILDLDDDLLLTRWNPQDQGEDLTEECIFDPQNFMFSVQAVELSNSLTEGEDLVSLCLEEPTYNEAGRKIYPIEKKYKNIEFLGQVFTAYNCEAEGNGVYILDIMGVEDEKYTLGSVLWLNKAPSPELTETLNDVGYDCIDGNKTDNECTKWQLENYITIENLMKLEPYYKEFRQDDCLNCG